GQPEDRCQGSAVGNLSRLQRVNRPLVGQGINGGEVQQVLVAWLGLVVERHFLRRRVEGAPLLAAKVDEQELDLPLMSRGHTRGACSSCTSRCRPLSPRRPYSRRPSLPRSPPTASPCAMASRVPPVHPEAACAGAVRVSSTLSKGRAA